jgi:amino acid adenylation domain-containing protein
MSPVAATSREPGPATAPRRLASGRGQELRWYAPSPGQRRLWFLDRLQPGSASFNMGMAPRLGGALKVRCLARALEVIVGRHEPLRTALLARAGEPVQVVRPPGPLPLPVVDLCGLPGAAALPLARRLTGRQRRRTFDLRSGRVVRALLLRLGPRDHVFQLTLHHVACDEWSRGILVRELSALYSADRDGRPPRLPELPISYAAYASWQNRWLESEPGRHALDYWRRQLAGELPVLALPTDRPRPAILGSRGERRALSATESLEQAVQRLARTSRVTSFTVALAAFAALLSRYSGQREILVGSPVANRPLPETENLVGFFVNPLVLRVPLGDDPSFRRLLERTQGVVLGALEHQTVPFERLIEELQPQRDLSRSPLFQVSLVSLDRSEGRQAEGLRLADLEVEHFGTGGGLSAKFDLTLFATLAPGKLQLVAEFSPDLFDHATIHRLLRHLLRLLEGAAGDPERAVSTLPLLAAAERHQLAVELNDTARPCAARPVHVRIAARARRVPEAVAVVGGDERWSYGWLDLCSRRLASELRRRGVVRGAVVAILLRRRPLLPAALLAVLRCGAAYLPLDPDYPPQRIADLLADAGAVAVIVGGETAGLPPPGAFAILDVEALAGGPPPPAAELPEGTVDDLAYLIYTSGSTGRPKGVLVPHRGLTSYLDWAVETYRAGDGQGVPVHSSLGFDLTVTSLFAPLLAGSAVILIPERKGLEGLLATFVSGADFSLVKLTPSHLDAVTSWLDERSPAVRIGTLVVGGEALRAEAVARWRALAPRTRVINEYGPTETVVGCCIEEVGGEVGSGTVAIGRPAPHSRLLVADSRRRLVPLGVSGELLVAGPGVAWGYLRRPRETAERFVPDPWGGEVGGRLYRTGDRVRRLADGRLDFLGRLDDQVKVRGHRIEPGEIEAVLRQHPQVREGAVTWERGRDGGGELSAFAVCEEATTGEELRGFLARRLPLFMVPGRVVVRAQPLPRTPHGKIDRRALADGDGPRDGGARAGVEPRDFLEHRLLEIWREVLGDADLGVTDDFFAVGGHSLAAVQVLARVRRELGFDFPLSAFFVDATVERLAGAIRRATRYSRSVAVPLQRDGSKPPLFLAHPVGGGVICYVPLARRLGSRQPVWGFQARLDQPYSRFEELAADYVAAMRQVAPGPYLLGGWSFGAVVAYEMACQLERSGVEPALLLILDAPAPVAERRTSESRFENVDLDQPVAFLDAVRRAIGLHLPVDEEQLKSLPAPEGMALLVKVAKRYQVLPPDLELEDLAESLESFKRMLRLRHRWRPRPYHGAIVLVRADSEDPSLSPEGRRFRAAEAALGWDRLAAGGVEVRKVAGAHADMVWEPHVEGLAAVVADCIAGVSEPEPARLAGGGGDGTIR